MTTVVALNEAEGPLHLGGLCLLLCNRLVYTYRGLSSGIVMKEGLALRHMHALFIVLPTPIREE